MTRFDQTLSRLAVGKMTLDKLRTTIDSNIGDDVCQFVLASSHSNNASTELCKPQCGRMPDP